MPSTFSWLDVSAQERRTMLQVVDLFREKGTVDELGIGQIRDAFADHFFPGTSTLHTRARYLLFIPWIYLQLERDRVTGDQARRRAHTLQANDLVAALQAGGERSDVLGIEARDSLLRPPAEVYWGALGRYGIRRFPGSRERYHGTFDARRAGFGAPVHDESGELLEPAQTNWSTDLPGPPSDLLEVATFDLTGEEASFLRERILATAPQSLLALLLQRPPGRNAPALWADDVVRRADKRLRREIRLAERFSLLMHGATITYNVMLAEAAVAAGLRDEELGQRYQSDYDAWVDGEIRPVLSELRRWDRGELWAFLANVAPRTAAAREFSESWMQVAIADPWSGASDPSVRERIRQRERVNKGSLARLSNPRALERWSGASGLGRLQYRWPNAQRVIRDVAAGLKRAG